MWPKYLLHLFSILRVFLEPIEEESDDTKIKHIQEHIPFALALHSISRLPDYQPDPIVRVKTKPNENMVKEFLKSRRI